MVLHYHLQFCKLLCSCWHHGRSRRCATLLIWLFCNHATLKSKILNHLSVLKIVTPNPFVLIHKICLTQKLSPALIIKWTCLICYHVMYKSTLLRSGETIPIACSVTPLPPWIYFTSENSIWRSAKPKPLLHVNWLAGKSFPASYALVYVTHLQF